MNARFLVIRAAIALGVLVLVAGGASAGTLSVDFDDGNNPLSGGVISTRFAYSGTNSLYVDSNFQTASMELPDGNKGGTLSMMVYDTGKWVGDTFGTCYGPRWGITAADGNDYGIGLINKSYFASWRGYAFNPGHNSRYSSWYSHWWFGDLGHVWRQCTLADEPWPQDPNVHGDANYHDDTAATEGTGQWTKWVFVVAPDGNTVVTAIDGNGVLLGTLTEFFLSDDLTEVWLYGSRVGSLGDPLTGIFVDDIVWTPVPEPTAMALLSGGAVWALIRRRKRRGE